VSADRSSSSQPARILTTGCNDWQSGLDIVVESDADRVTAPDRLERLAEAWATNWYGLWRFQLGEGAFQHPDGGQALLFAVAPKNVLAFGKGTFSRTRHRFTEPPDTVGRTAVTSERWGD
jgi:hypothetical protein